MLLLSYNVDNRVIALFLLNIFRFLLNLPMPPWPFCALRLLDELFREADPVREFAVFIDIGSFLLSVFTCEFE